MFATVMKHEWKAMSSMVLLTWGIGALIYVVSAAAAYLFDVFGMRGWMVLSVILAILVLVAVPFVIMIMLLVNYYSSLYGRRASFVHTVPATAKQLVGAHMVLNSLIYLVTNIVAAALGAGLIASIVLAETQVAVPWDELEKVLGVFPIWFVVAVVVAVVVAIISVTIIYQAAISLGNLPAFRRLGKYGGIALWFVFLYIVGQAVSLFGGFITPGYAVFNADAANAGHVAISFHAAPMVAQLISFFSDPTSRSHVVESGIPIGGMIIPSLAMCIVLWLVANWAVEKELEIR